MIQYGDEHQLRPLVGSIDTSQKNGHARSSENIAITSGNNPGYMLTCSVMVWSDTGKVSKRPAPNKRITVAGFPQPEKMNRMA